MSINTQPPESISAHKLRGEVLDIHSIFYTIQGEGPLAGRAAVFVRLAGCNLQCPMCDTEYTSGRQNMGVDTILRRVQEMPPRAVWPIVVLTGGEPLRQNIALLVWRLYRAGYDVQVETNGTVPIPVTHNFAELVAQGALTIVVSPKLSKVHPSVAALASAWKYVVGDEPLAEDLLPRRALEQPPGSRDLARPTNEDAALYIQPCDYGDEFERTAAATRNAVEAVMGTGRRHLSLQMHKIAGLE